MNIEALKERILSASDYELANNAEGLLMEAHSAIERLQAENAELRRGNEVLLAQVEALHKAGDALDLLPGATLTTDVVSAIQRLRNPTPEMLLAMTQAFAEHFSPGITGSGATYDNISATLASKMYRAAIVAARQQKG